MNKVKSTPNPGFPKERINGYRFVIPKCIFTIRKELGHAFHQSKSIFFSSKYSVIKILVTISELIQFVSSLYL